MAKIIDYGTRHKLEWLNELHSEEFILYLTNLCTFTLLVYATLLRFSEEVEYIWRKRFSLVTLFYIITRYGSLLNQGPEIDFGIKVIPKSKHLCNAFFHFTAFWFVLAQVGIQGLLIFRAYAVCKGSRLLGAILVFAFLAGMILLILNIVGPYGCYTAFRLPGHRIILSFTFGISTICTSLLVLGICTWSLWGTWKLKCQSGIGHRNDLVSIFFKQNVLKCCIVIFFMIVKISVGSRNIFLSIILGRIQTSLLTIIFADFTLDLRQCNRTGIDESTSFVLSSSTLRIQNFLQNVHESILVEMGTPEDVEAGERNDREDDEIPNTIGGTTVGVREQITPVSGCEFAC